ncbi:3-oxoacyl-ACP synthase III family protein [Streptococcus mutans]|uniref:3-oxoacyl-ACP synthase III family protein n=1 Tax=Streptococcus mutans TaxID=1309 RepID=UPI000F6DE2E9|nr:ketoacyl-ACP synthase III [Streptococcus mutans]MCB5050637.1 ketoacyl-ACP synthase III [Streptococcus mutans]MCY7125220.1 ketoacyl-ACP synthase III [Streptococcus mutans]MDT9539619.1 ketoacyl-ACP synthase III [Streptococcus mutans]NLQ33800.1 ketoacyl-ACP synthase III [Streptococcus mutans]NLQ39467.1 ketoacyl-ACP synthase III [Streptococcus mutans]
MNNAGIAGVGYYVPERTITNDEFIKYVNTTSEWMEKKIGIKERRFAANNEAMSDFALNASQMALDDANLTSKDIDLIIVCAINQDRRVPATAAILQKKLGAINAAAFDMNLGGCPGSCYSLVVGQQFIETGMYNNVLVVAGEIYSKLIDISDRNISVFFGDGAGAMILKRCKEGVGILNSLLGTDGKQGIEKITFSGGSRIPYTLENVKQNKIKGEMDNNDVWKFATKKFPQIVRDVTEQGNKTLNDLDWIIPHQANINIIKYGMKKLNLPMSITHTTIHKYANTGGGSVPITLAEAVQIGKIKPGDLIVLASYGAGYSWGASLIKWCAPEDFI